MGSSFGDLFASNVDFHGDLVRNIPGIRTSQQLFDDLSSEPGDWELAIAAEAAERIATSAALITRPFDYGSVITYSFQSAHWLATRFSDGTAYGVWYGSTEPQTTVVETAFHWHRFVIDTFGDVEREIVTERRLFNVRCAALLIDLRDKVAAFPALVSRSSYGLTQDVGRYLHEQGLSGLLTRSARCDGTNAAVLNAQRLSNVRHRSFVTYRLDVPGDRLVVERTPGRTWLSLQPSQLGSEVK